MKRWQAWLGLVFLAGAAMPAFAADSVDAVASDYVELALGARLLDPELVSVNDPRPGELAKAQAARRDAAAIARTLGTLEARLDRIPAGTDRLEAMRWRALRARIESLRVQMRAADAPKLSVAEDVTRRFGFVPTFHPLSDYDAALVALDAAMPGKGSLPERIDAMKKSAIVPPDRLEAVARAAIAECRRRTVAHLALPPERIDLQFPDDAMFPASAVYAGNGLSIVTASRTIPADVDRVLQYSCHEVYPGHHVHFVTIDQALYRGRHWAEYAVELNVGPFVPVAEAVAEYGVGLAFPVEERLAFERDVLFPLAGLTMADPAQWRAYLAARSSVLGATSTVARDFLAGTIGADEARRLLVRYRLQTPEAADQMLKMMPVLGSYVIASDLGWYTIDRKMQGKPTTAQWELLHRIESQPMLLDDIAALH